MNPSLVLDDRKPLLTYFKDRAPTVGAFCSREKKFQICSVCIMDTTDPLIIFSRETGQCNHCINALNYNYVRPAQSINLIAIEKFKSRIKKIKKVSDYDCILGLSGGVDSSYLALLAKELNLNPLLLHIDAGWNTNVANTNINKIIEFTGFDFITKVLDWEKVKNLQISFLASGIANQDTPQDYLFNDLLLSVARDFKIKFILSGSNLSTESILPKEWGYNSLDGKHIRDIQSKFAPNHKKIINTKSLWYYNLILPTLYNFEIISLLDFIPYSRNNAVNFLQKSIGWEDYGGKHNESIWTRYFQNYLLPYRFGYDKRKAHLSSRIISGEINREESLRMMETSTYNDLQIENDEIFIAKKLGINLQQFLDFKTIPLTHYSDFKNSYRSGDAIRFTNKIASTLKNVLKYIH